MLKTLKNHNEKMSVRVNVRMSKIMRTPIKLGVRAYATDSNYRNLIDFEQVNFAGCEV